MTKNAITLKTAGIIAGVAAVCAFLIGIAITATLPAFTNRIEAAATEQSTKLPISTETGNSSFADIAEVVSPAVVNISAEKKVSQDFGEFDRYFEGPFEDFFRDFFRGFPRREGKTRTLGSGFIITSDGYIVTNYHVIKGATESGIYIRMTNKKEFKGNEVKIVGIDEHTDLALLKVDNDENLPSLAFGDSDKARVGDWVIAFGNPFQLEGTVTVGVISAKGRANIPLPEGPDFQSFIQTDAAINPGNSGGPLVDIHGDVIGINTAITSPSGGNIGIGFAIPANLAKTIIDELKTEGKVVRGYLGVWLQDITEDLKEAMHLPSLNGVLISEVVDDSPASRGGVKAGDVVLEFNNEKVADMQSFRLQVASTPVGKTVKMKIFRDDREKVLNIKIGERPDEVSATERTDQDYNEFGLTVANTTDSRAQRLNPEAEHGVIVIQTEPDSPAERASISPGDNIIAIGKKEIEDTDDYYAALKSLEKSKPVIFQVQRNGRKLYIAVTP
jgi:serine protease Do